MRCRACGTELLPGKSFCHACGARAVQTCAQCGAEIDAGFRFCPDCGHALVAEAPVAPHATSRVPDGLAEKIRAAQSLPGERKQVTVLFCDLAGSTAVASGLDPEVYREVLDQYVALAMHEVYRFEGIVNQISGDGFMALFGAPLAHEDAPQRAVLAALAIRDALAHFNAQLQRERGVALPARIGLNTGPVVVGTVGNDLKMDYTAIGDTTNLAARLEQLAQPGTILISEATARLVRGRARLREVGPLAVKGKAEPVPAYEVLEAREQASPMSMAAERGLTPFVGRDEELAQLDGCFRRVGGHYTQVVSVVGAAGSGKSRLIYEFRQRGGDDPEPVQFLEGRCAALTQSIPLAPFVAMLRQYFDLAADDDEARACRKVETRLGKGLEAVDRAFPLLCRVLSVPAHPAADLPLERLKRETFEAIAKLVHAESVRAPVVLLLEDLHWIDEPSQELLEMAIARLSRARVMILLSHRPEYRPQWRTEAAVTQVHLRPLLDPDVLRIARSLAGGALPDELEARILAKAEGSPFFAEEITRSLVEEGFLAAADGAVRLTRPVDEILIPGGVREVIAARLDRLPASAKHVAQLAAVLGRQFHRDQLAQLLADEPVDLEHELDELRRRGVIHRKSLFSDDEYRFGESLTQEVAYDSLLHRQRRLLHGRVAALLEAGGGDGGLARPALLAHHFARSDDRARAVETLLRAAAEAEQMPSFRTALDLYRQAWEISEALLADAPDDARVPRWLMEATVGFTRVTVLYGSSADPDAERAALRGRELALQLGAVESAGLVRTMHGMLLTVDPERFAEGVAITEAAVAEARASGDPMLALSASRAVAWHYLLDGRFDAARATIEWVERGLQERDGAPGVADLYLGARLMHDGILQAGDELALAFTRANETLAIAERATNHTVRAGTSVLLAQLHLQRADFDAAREWAQRGLEIAEQIGNVAGLQRARALLLAARVGLGEPVTLGTLGDALEDGIRRGGNAIVSVQPIVDACLALGELGRAERVARLALERAAGRYRQLLASAALADVLVRLGPSAWAEAERGIDRALGVAEAIHARSSQAQLLVAAARLALDRDLPHEALRALERARALSAEIGLVRFAGAIPMLAAQAESASRASA
ncbi:MAG: adenylate/guanylate cyclase domain-containing protein [Candidatus Binatia bacterium]